MEIEQFINPTTITQLGLSAIFLWLYLSERKNSKESAQELKVVYEKNNEVLRDNTKAFEGLMGSLELLKESQKNAIDNNTKAVDTLVTNMTMFFKDDNTR